MHNLTVSNINCHRLSIAPMIDWTYSHFRVFMRFLAPEALLYTEMQTTGAVFNNPQRALYYDSIEHPIALQLGGSDKAALVEAALQAEQLGYDEINLNLGCPSDRVQAGRFGACLMAEPKVVAECISALSKSVRIPVTAKTRIGIDQQDSYEFFQNFVQHVVDAGAQKLIVHARKAWLNGLNPKQNRTIPPVQYDYVYQIRKEYSNLPVVINGNIKSIAEIKAHLQQVDGVMLGRLACDNPYSIAQIHHALYPESRLFKRSEYAELYFDYLIQQHKQGVPLSLLIKPLFNLSYGLPGANQWKRGLTSLMQSKEIALLDELLSFLRNVECNVEEIL